MTKFILLSLCLFLQISCFRNTDKLVTVIEKQPNSLDPVNAYTDSALLVLSQVYEPLINYHYLLRPFRMEPVLSQKIPQVSGKGRVYRFEVKKYSIPSRSRGTGREDRSCERFYYSI